MNIVVINFLGLVFNLSGTILVSLSAGTLLTRIHAALLAHQATLEASLRGERNIPLFTGLDEGRGRELERNGKLLRFGLWLIVVGFVVQAGGGIVSLLRQP